MKDCVSLFHGCYSYPLMKNVVFGDGFVEALLKEVHACNAQSILLLVSRTLSQKTDYVDQIGRALGDKLVGVCANIPSHTPRESVVDAALMAKEKGVDLLVTLGGSSITDAAKMVALCLGNNVVRPEQLADLHPRVTSDGEVVQPEMAQLNVRAINIPTTLAAAEYSDIAACNDMQRHIKEVYHHPLMMPQSVILDPRVTLDTPEWLFFSTGIRSVDHAVETICSRQCHPVLEASCVHALGLLSAGLLGVKNNPEDLGARLDCQIGSWMSMIGVQSGIPLGGSHGIGHALGGSAGVPHGYTSCVMLPHVLRFNLDVNADRQSIVSRALGCPDVSAADAVSLLVESLGLPMRLRDLEVDKSILGKVADDAMTDWFVHNNPRSIESADVVRRLLELAW